eukprot:scaffold18138_cov128-Cylindrotheca_fusiformis.AAC.4
MELYNDSVANAIESWKNPSRRAAFQRVSAAPMSFQNHCDRISRQHAKTAVDSIVRIQNI